MLCSVGLFFKCAGDSECFEAMGFKKTSVPYPVSQVLDLLVYRDLHFHDNFPAFPITNSSGSVIQTVLRYSKFTTTKLDFWYRHFSICYPECSRFWKIPLWPTNPSHSCYLTCLDAPWKDDAFLFLREHPPSALSNFPSTSTSNIESHSGRELPFFGSSMLPACTQKSF